MTAVLRLLEIMVGIIFFHLPVGVMTRARVVTGGSLISLKWRMCQNRVALGHRIGSPEALWIIFLSLTHFFCVINVSVTNVSDWRSASIYVAAKMLWSHLKAMYSEQKGALSDLDPVYSPGQRKKKYAIIVMLHYA